MYSPYFLSIASVLLVSIISLVGVIFFSFHESVIRKYLLLFVSFSVGALLGTVFLHMIPEMLENHDFISTSLLIVLLGILGSFVIEKFIHWRHCHSLDCRANIHPVGMINLIGDAVHNFIDGLLIAGSYIVSIPLGITTTIAVVLHEIPQEIGDFAVLLYSGYSKKKAILFNFLSALTAVAGAILVLIGSTSLPNIGMYLIPLTAGNFLYIAGTDLIPELHKDTRLHQAAIQLLCMTAGIALMYTLTLGTSHSHGTPHAEEGHNTHEAVEEMI
jgi:zinc and cadmium transporter